MKIHFLRGPFSGPISFLQKEGRIVWGERGNEKEKLVTDLIIHLAPNDAARKITLE